MDNKDDMSDLDFTEYTNFPAEDLIQDVYSSEENTLEHARLPTGKTERRLIKKSFREIRNNAGGIKETMFNLQCALQMSSNKNKFAAEWIEKTDILGAVQQKLAEAESMLMLASGASRGSYPVVSSSAMVRASNKVSASQQKERRPCDVRAQRQKRERFLERTHKHLDAVQTPLVEANRPNKKRKSEASRNQKNYKIAARKLRIPESLHPSIS